MRWLNGIMCLTVGCLMAAPTSAQGPVLPGVDGSVCDFVAANTGKEIGSPLAIRPNPRLIYDLEKPFDALLTKRALADVDGDGDLELLDVGTSAGTAHGDVPMVLGAGNQFGNPLPSASDDSIRWANGARWLLFAGAWHLVYFQDEQLEQAMAVDTVTGGGRLACLFDYGFEEKIVDFGENPALTGAYQERLAANNHRRLRERQAANGSPLQSADRRYLMSVGDGFREVEDSLRGEGDNREIVAVGTSAIVASDIDGDGAKERIARLNKSSGAGRGCDASLLELMPDDGKTEPDAVKRDALRRAQVQEAQGLAQKCGQRAELVDIAGRGYIYVERLGASRRERRLVDGQGHLIIKSEFTPTHTVTFDLAKGGKIEQKQPN